jgi:hypothetical protein
MPIKLTAAERFGGSAPPTWLNMMPAVVATARTPAETAATRGRRGDAARLNCLRTREGLTELSENAPAVNRHTPIDRPYMATGHT